MQLEGLRSTAELEGQSCEFASALLEEIATCPRHVPRVESDPDVRLNEGDATVFL
jgi:hypothetical protein